MGRIKKYKTKEAKQLAKRVASNKYYWKNKDEQDRKARERYGRTNNKNLSS